MEPQQRRRIRPLRKPSRKPARRKRIVRAPIPWKDRAIQGCIGLFIIADIILVSYLIGHCSKPKLGRERKVVQTQVPEEPEVPQILEIEVLNGCGVTGLAGKFTDYLRSEKFEGKLNVVNTGNYEEGRPGRGNYNVLKTIIIDRIGNRRSCELLAEAIGCPDPIIVEETHGDFVLDVSLVLGRDYKQLGCWKTVESQYE